MMWYYMKRGSVRVRNIVSDEQLRMMARAGDLDKTDLLWSDQTEGKWVRAASIADLFVTEAGPEPEAEKEPAPEETTPSPPPEKEHHHKSAIVAVIVAVIAIAGVLAVIKFKGSIQPPTPPPAPPPPVETNQWEAVEADFATLVKNEMIMDAQELISAYVSDSGEDATSARMRGILEARQKREKLSELYASFIKGKANAEQKEQLIALSQEMEELSNLKSSLSATLTAKKLPSEGLCRSILDLSKSLADEPLRLACLSTLARIVEASSSEKGCLEMVRVYKDEGMQKQSTALLENFVKSKPNATNAWFELSAHLALEKRNDEALESLKTAVKLGGEDARIDARRDPRFESIKDTWSFKWNTR